MFWCGDVNKPDPAIGRHVLNAPLFLWNQPADDEILFDEWLNARMNRKFISEPNLLPFQCLRLYATANDTFRRGEIKALKFWVVHASNRLTLYVFPENADTSANTVLYNIRIWDKGSAPSVTVACCVLNKKGERSRWLLTKEEISRLTQGRFEEWVPYVLSTFYCFVSELLSPSNFIAEVAPNRKHKSVEWIKSRTHHVLLHKSHPANKETPILVNGKVVEDEKYRHRMAHTRRAHTRLLRSSRFRRNADGSTRAIRVRACWCGPKEWAQADSIYKVLN